MVRLLILAAVLAIIVTSAAAQTKPPSAFTMSKADDYTDVSLSPDGKHVAAIITRTIHYCSGVGGKVLDPEMGECEDKPYRIETRKKIDIYDLNTFEPVKVFRVPAGGTPIGLEWASNTHLLATGFWAPFLKGNMLVVGGMRTFSVSLKSQEAPFLFSDQQRVAKQNWNLSKITNRLRLDPLHVVMPANNGGDLGLWKVNVETGKAVRVARGKTRTFHWYTDDMGRAVMRFDCSGRSCRKVNVYVPVNAGGDNEEKWKKIKSFKTRPDEDTQEYDFWPIAQSDDPNTFYVMSYEDSDERQSVKLFDLTTATFTETVFEHPELDVSGAFIDPLTGRYAGAFFTKDRIDYAFEDQEKQAHYDKIKSHFENDENVGLMGFNAAGSKAMVYVTSPNNPGSYHVYDSGSGDVTQLFQGNPDLDGRFPTRANIMKIPAQDGTLLTAYHTVAATAESQSNTQINNLANKGAAPLLVMPHGGPEARDSYDYDPWVQYFAMRGYQVLQVNFRGSSGYGRAFAEAGYRQWGGHMQTDVTDAVQHFYDKGIAAPENTCMVGYRYGGYAALYAGAASPEMFACTVAGGGISDLPRFLKQIKKDHGSDTGLYEYRTTSIGNPKTDKDALKAVSPVNLAASFRKPVLLIHGNQDGVVNISQSNKMLKALKKAGKDVEFVELKGAGHSNWGVRNDVIFLEAVEDFLEKHLTGPISP